MFLNLYKSMVWPHIEYATQVWSPQYKLDRITLENVQRRATHFKHLLCLERLKPVGLPTLEYCRERAGLHDSGLEKDLWHFDRVYAYFSDAIQNFPMHKISLVSI